MKFTGSKFFGKYFGVYGRATSKQTQKFKKIRRNLILGFWKFKIHHISHLQVHKLVQCSPAFLHLQLVQPRLDLHPHLISSLQALAASDCHPERYPTTVGIINPSPLVW